MEANIKARNFIGTLLPKRSSGGDWLASLYRWTMAWLFLLDFLRDGFDAEHYLPGYPAAIMEGGKVL